MPLCLTRCCASELNPPLIQRIVHSVLKETNTRAYQTAISLVKRIRKLMHKMKDKDEFKSYVESLREAYARKRKFVGMLDELKA